MDQGKARLVLGAAIDACLDNGMSADDVKSYVALYLIEEGAVPLSQITLPPPVPVDQCPTCGGSGNGTWSAEKAERVYQEFAEQMGGTIDEAREQLGTAVGYEPCPTCDGTGRLGGLPESEPMVIGERPPDEDDALPEEQSAVWKVLEAAYAYVPEESKVPVERRGPGGLDLGDAPALLQTDGLYLFELARFWTGERNDFPSEQLFRPTTWTRGGSRVRIAPEAKHRARLLRHAARTAAREIGWIRPGVRVAR